MTSRSIRRLVILAVGVPLFVAFWLVLLHPGSLRWTAPLVCPDEQPDGFVINYEGEQYDGGRTPDHYTLYCMGEDGDYSNAGLIRSWAIVLGVVTLVVLPPTIWFGVRTA